MVRSLRGDIKSITQCGLLENSTYPRPDTQQLKRQMLWPPGPEGCGKRQRGSPAACRGSAKGRLRVFQSPLFSCTSHLAGDKGNLFRKDHCGGEGRRRQENGFQLTIRCMVHLKYIKMTVCFSEKKKHSEVDHLNATF